MNDTSSNDNQNWKTAYRSFYYAGAEDPDDIKLNPATTALLVIDVQNTYMLPKESNAETARWQPFYDRMNNVVIPNIARLISECRERGVEVIFARIACHKTDGRDRSLSQKKPGFNYLLIPKDSDEGQFVPELAPTDDDIVVIKNHRQCTDRNQSSTNAAQYGNNRCYCNRYFYRPVRFVDCPEPCR